MDGDVDLETKNVLNMKIWVKMCFFELSMCSIRSSIPDFVSKFQFFHILNSLRKLILHFLLFYPHFWIFHVSISTGFLKVSTFPKLYTFQTSLVFLFFFILSTISYLGIFVLPTSSISRFLSTFSISRFFYFIHFFNFFIFEPNWATFPDWSRQWVILQSKTCVTIASIKKIVSCRARTRRSNLIRIRDSYRGPIKNYLPFAESDTLLIYLVQLRTRNVRKRYNERTKMSDSDTKTNKNVRKYSRTKKIL